MKHFSPNLAPIPTSQTLILGLPRSTKCLTGGGRPKTVPPPVESSPRAPPPSDFFHRGVLYPPCVPAIACHNSALVKLRIAPIAAESRADVTPLISRRASARRNAAPSSPSSRRVAAPSGGRLPRRPLLPRDAASPRHRLPFVAASWAVAADPWSRRRYGQRCGAADAPIPSMATDPMASASWRCSARPPLQWRPPASWFSSASPPPSWWRPAREDALCLPHSAGRAAQPRAQPPAQGGRAGLVP